MRGGWRPDCRGQTTVEFALAILCVLLPVILGTIEVGRGVWYYHQLSQLSREGARWLVVTSANASTAYTRPGNAPGTYLVSNTAGYDADSAVSWIAQMKTGVPSEALTVRITCLLTLPAGGTYLHAVPMEVEVEYPYRPIITSMLNIPAEIRLQAQTTMQMQ